MIEKIFQYRTGYRDQGELFGEVSRMLVEGGYVTEGFEEALRTREASFPTCLPLDCPVAIPHTDGDCVRRDAVVCVLNDEGLEFRALGDPDTVLYPRLFFVLVMKEGGSHLQELQRLVEHLQDDELVLATIDSATEDEFERNVERCI